MAQDTFGKMFKVENDTVVGYDNQGNKIYSNEHPGELADFDEALELLVNKYPYKDNILKSSGRSGSGSQGSGTF